MLYIPVGDGCVNTESNIMAAALPCSSHQNKYINYTKHQACLSIPQCSCGLDTRDGADPANAHAHASLAAQSQLQQPACITHLHSILSQYPCFLKEQQSFSGVRCLNTSAMESRCSPCTQHYLFVTQCCRRSEGRSGTEAAQAPGFEDFGGLQGTTDLSSGAKCLRK